MTCPPAPTHPRAARARARAGLRLTTPVVAATLATVAALLLAPAARAQGGTEGGARMPAAAVPADARLLLRRDVDREVLARTMMARADSVGARGAALYALRRDARGALVVDLFVRGGAGVEGALRDRGISVGTHAGEWLVARAPLDRLAEIIALPGVRGVEIASRAHPHDDSSMVDIGATAVRQRVAFDDYQGSGGRGAIVGIVDTGIDYRHPDFLEDATGRSRIAYLWDQTAAGLGPGDLATVFRYGLECTRTELTAGSCPVTDEEGHGTHVAGIAAGDGSGARVGVPTFVYAGVAPAADLIVVKTDFSFASVVEGVDYIFRRAAQLGRPAVVNLSLGGLLGPHDGTEAPALALDALSGPGRIVVASVGNDGDNRNGGANGIEQSIHAETTLAVGASGTIGLGINPYAPVPGPGNDLLLLQAYHDASDTFDVTITRPDGTTVLLPAGSASVVSTESGGGVVAYHGAVAGDSILGADLEIGSFSPTSPSHTISIYLGEWVTNAPAPGPGLWTITLRRVAGHGRGTVDAYLPYWTVRALVGFTTGASNRRLVSTPADARRVIAVGAYATRATWTSVDGRRYGFTNADSVALGDALLFSSPGPTRDGRLKPEISAPGRVLSSLSRQAGFPLALIASDSAHAMLEGTSMAAPHVTGAVALLLARRPTLTPEEALAALEASARHDGFTARSHALDAGTPNATWGWGKLDVPGALARVPAAPGAVLASQRTLAPRMAQPQSVRGARVALERLRLTATDAESLAVSRLVARVSGRDAGFMMEAVLDSNRNGEVDAGEPVVARSGTIALSDVEQTLALVAAPGRFVIPRGGVVEVVLAGVLSGQVPNATAFRGAIVPDSGTVTGLESGVSHTLAGTLGGGLPVRTTLLAAGERLSVSENPVRQGPLVINFDEAARRITLYDFAGRAVRRLVPAPDERRVTWDLRTANGTPVANGAYLLVLELYGSTVKQTLLVRR